MNRIARILRFRLDWKILFFRNSVLVLGGGEAHLRKYISSTCLRCGVNLGGSIH